MKECARCGGVFDADVFFGRRAVSNAYLTRRPVCLGCEQTARDAVKAADRWPTKIRDTIRRHAAKLQTTVAVLEYEFGWHFQRMLHDADHAYKNGCAYCGHAFREMGHGLHDLTLDIVEPSTAPFYVTNTRWVCMTCNRAKSRTPSALWAAKLACWDRWRRQPKGPRQLRLFKGDDDDDDDDGGD